ncbi:MAG: hypothetical protein KJN63_06400 [Acidimicrobiia bacterium]|nr:hypothetical protein [Acidimicrobiia bacterium]
MGGLICCLSNVVDEDSGGPVVTGEIWVVGEVGGGDDVDEPSLPVVHAVSNASAQHSAPH